MIFIINIYEVHVAKQPFPSQQSIYSSGSKNLLTLVNVPITFRSLT